MKKIILSLLCVCAVIGINISCSMTVAGGSSSTDNGKVIGMIQWEIGWPAPYTQVILLPADYNPFAATVDICYDTTDSQGVYEFNDISPGTYTIQAIHIDLRKKALITGIEVDEDTLVIGPDSLKKTGAIKVFLPDSVDPVNGYVYIPGTTIAKPLGGNTVSVIIDSVPAGVIPSVYYATVSGTPPQPIRYYITVIPNEVATITMPTWNYSKQLYLNTSSSGAQVSGNVLDFPVLVRLSAANFNFMEAEAGGEDIRFTKPDNTILPYEIEYWNAAEQEAAIWVKVDTVYGNNDTQHIIMVWGKSGIVSASNSAAVFDTATGFQGVWHLAEAGNITVKDATINHYDGTPTGMSATSAVDGIIGGAQEFNGSTSCFIMAHTAASTLNFPLHGPYTVSAWVYTDTLDTAFHTIVSKGNRQYSLGVMASEWGFSVVPTTGGWDITTSAAASKAWTNLVAIRNGTSQYLFANGICIDSTITNTYPGTTPDTGGDLTIGKKPNDSTDFIDGIIDEVCISGVARDPAWIKLSYMNQKADDALVEFK